MKLTPDDKWSLNVNTLLPDDLGQDYVRPLREVSGTFSMKITDPTFEILGSNEPTPIYMYLPCEPAWWGRLKHRLLRTDPGSYVAFQGTATPSIDSNMDGVVGGSLKYLGPVTFSPPPMSRLERVWNRICTRIKRYAP